ncbi:MAG: site-specific integrase [Prevotellaceae bacterium]|nr:site-specific integrase [Prevotellaceae bacterium]
MNRNKTTEGRTRKGFIAFIKGESERQRQNGHISVANNYRSAGNSLARFLRTKRKTDVSFKKLTALLMADYEAWLQVDGLCKNTTSFYFRTLQSVYHKAVRQGWTDDRKPFADVYRGVAKTVKRAIDAHEVCQLKALDIRAALIRQGYDGKALAKLLCQLEFSRNIFIFCFCARGLTFVDLAHMKKANVVDDTLVYVRRKTKQRMEVRIEPMMQEILTRYPSDTEYLLPILSKTGDGHAVYHHYRYALARYNRHLKMLGCMLGGLKLTSYVSRHSWASAAYSQHVPLSIISLSMGHDSEKTTEIYLKSLESNVLNKTNHRLLTHIFRT